MQLFSGVYQQCTGYVWAPVHARFCEAQKLVEQFKNADKEERSLLRPKLKARGFI
jgi:hypothetical protein